MSAYSQTLEVQNNIKSAVNEMGMSDIENGYEMKRHSQVNSRDIRLCSAGSRVTMEGRTN